MKKCRKIAIIGHFGGNESFLDGQTVKTKTLYDELIDKTNWKIKKVDTYYKKKRPLKLIIDTFFSLIFYKNIIVLLSCNGMKVYFPILYFFSVFLKKNIYHDVIGGNLHIHAKSNPKYIKYLNSYKINWVETNYIKNQLVKLGINNCSVLPNFKRLNIVNKIDVTQTSKDYFKFCTFSRVMKEKGISDAIYAIQNLNREGFNCHLDIYGPIDEKYKNELNNLIDRCKQFVSYCGMVQFDKSTEILKKYDLLLFPTFWKGEGFPGTIIDAFSAGLPVVATDWNCNSEIVSNYINGIIYPNQNEKTLEESIVCIISNHKLFNQMKKNALIEAKKYIPDEYIGEIIDYINSNN